MEENNEIKIVKLGKQLGCMFNDKIQIEVTPDWLYDIAHIFYEKAINTKDYTKQGFYRQKSDFFTKAYNIWREARNEKDNNKSCVIKFIVEKLDEKESKCYTSCTECYHVDRKNFFKCRKLRDDINEEKVCKICNGKVIRETSILEANYETLIYHCENGHMVSPYR